MSEQPDLYFSWVAEARGERLDHFVVAQLGDASRADVQRWIKEGRILVNGQMAKPSLKLTAGNAVTLERPPRIETQIIAEQTALEILYEDADLLVVNKPAGMVVHPAPGHTSGTLVNALLGRDPALAGVGGPARAGIVHRLDRETSGLILVARTPAAFSHLQRQFKTRRVEKTYLALVEGVLDVTEGKIDAPIARDPAMRQRMAVLSPNRGGKRALSGFRVLRTYLSPFSQQRFEFSLLEVDLFTGRTHQIRVHMTFIKHPVVGDRIYGRRRQRIPSPRQFLHAHRLVFTHPRSGERIELACPLPADLQAVLEQLTSVQYPVSSVQ
ncbi:MAG: RluA family pseudouridine synthase [Caldilineales bacterium]